ncbi:Yeats family protein, partial [Globisporangium splendens]
MVDVRQKNVVVCKPIVYGSVATYLGRKAEETKTHRWSIYVRGVDNEDLSYMISKVVITLHMSFANPVRVLTEPPYEVTEFGWGEFETQIQIHFHDANERPVDIIHMLALYPPGNQPASTKKPVISEFYDELVFNEPTEFFYKKLMAGPDREAPPHTQQDFFPTYSDVAVLKTLSQAQDFVKQEIQETKDLLLHTDIELKELKDRLAEFTKKKKQAEKSAAAVRRLAWVVRICVAYHREFRIDPMWLRCVDTLTSVVRVDERGHMLKQTHAVRRLVELDAEESDWRASRPEDRFWVTLAQDQHHDPKDNEHMSKAAHALVRPECQSESTYDQLETDNDLQDLEPSRSLAWSGPALQQQSRTTDHRSSHARVPRAPRAPLDCVVLLVLVQCNSSAVGQHRRACVEPSQRVHRTPLVLVVQVPDAGRIGHPRARRRRARPELLAAGVRQLQHAAEPDEGSHLLQMEERDPLVEHDGCADAQPMLAGPLGRRRVVEEAQVALPQVRPPRRHDGQGVHERQDPVQRQAGRDPDACAPVAADLDLWVPVVAAGLLLLDRAHPNARDAADAEGSAADPSGNECCVTLRVSHDRVDQIRDFSDARKKLNTKLLMAKDQRALLRIVDEHFSEMNDVNILTAVDRAARFASNPTSRKNRVSVTPRMNFLSKSEAPEDQLLDMSSSFLARPRTPQEIAMEKERFWKLILLAENLVNFSISIMKDGYELANFIKSIGRLGVGRQSILEPVAKQVLFVLNSDTEKHSINPHEVSIIATAIVHVSAKDLRGEPWMKDLLHAAANTLLDESTRKGKPSGLEVLIPLVRSFVIADEFHEELFALMFEELKRGRLETNAMLTPFKVRNLKSKLYQVNLDCLLHGRDTETLSLSPPLAEECKELFQSHQTQLKSTSFRIQHLVSTALDEMGIEHERSLGLDEGYSLDIALKKQMIAIEINDADSYQVLEDNGANEIPFGFVDLKARHLEQLGWVVIQLRADKYEQLGSVDDRARYLSMLLEVANNARRTQQ